MQQKEIYFFKILDQNIPLSKVPSNFCIGDAHVDDTCLSVSLTSFNFLFNIFETVIRKNMMSCKFVYIVDITKVTGFLIFFISILLIISLSLPFE